MLRILLVDDEKVVLNGLHQILSKHSPENEIVGLAQSGIEALQILDRREVNVVITDVKMPKMNGIELTKAICSTYKEVVVIVLSGYSDFEYVRQSMKNGAYDYLLKPCNYKEVINILKKVQLYSGIDDNKQHNKFDKKLLRSILKGHQQLPKKWREFNHLQMIAISIQGIQENSVKEYVKRELKTLDVMSELSEATSIDDNIILILKKQLDLSVIKENLYDYRQSLYKKGIQTYVVTYRFSYDNKCVEKAYTICRQMIEFLRFNELNICLDWQLYNRYLSTQEDYTANKYFSSNILGRYILNGDVEDTQKYLTLNLNKLYTMSSYVDPIKLKKEILEELLQLEKGLKDYRICFNELFNKQVDLLYELNRLKTFESLLHWLKNFTMAIVLSRKDKDSIPQYINIVLKYIDIHYMEKLTLNKVAQQVFLNPWYFSGQFKKHIGLSFSEYLNHVRVKMAIELLKQKDLKLYQISEMVGFKDAAYFSTVFKNIVKLTPKEYRKTV